MEENSVIFLSLLPIEALDFLNHPPLESLIKLHIETEDWLMGKRVLQTQQLHNVIGKLSPNDIKCRRELLTLKRDSYNLRFRDRHRDILKSHITYFDEVIYNEQLVFHRQLEVLAKTIESGRECVIEILNLSRRDLLRNFSSNSELLKGIAVSSPDLFREIQRVRISQTGEVCEYSEKVFRSFLHYVIRAATKTSVFSTFTSVGVIPTKKVWALSSNLLGLKLERSSNIVVDQYIIELFKERLVQSKFKDWLPIKLNPFYTIREERCEGIIVKTTRQGNRIIKHKVEYASWRASEKILKILTWLLQNKAKILRKADLFVYINDFFHGNETITKSMFDTLIELQILQYDIPNTQFENPIQTLISICESIPNAENTTSILKELQASLDTFSLLSGNERMGARSEIENTLSELFISIDNMPLTKKSNRLIYEDSLISVEEELLAVDQSRVETITKDLLTIRNILPVFDSGIIAKAILVEQFKSQFGPGGTCDNVIKFLLNARKVSKSILKNASRPHEERITLFESAQEYGRAFEEIYELREDVLRRFLFLLHSKQYQGDISNVWLESIINKIPERFNFSEKQFAFHGHIQDDTSNFLFTINQVMDGYGRHLLRYSNAIEAFRSKECSTNHSNSGSEKAGNRLVSFPSNTDEELIEISGSHGFSPNIHQTTTKRLLMIPGDVTWKYKENVVLLTDLKLRHDPVREQLLLFDPKEDTVFHPLYLGFMRTHLLGPIHASIIPLTQIFYTNRYRILGEILSSTDGMSLPFSNTSIRIGNVYLTRKSWYFRHAQLEPFREAVVSPSFRNIVELTRWREMYNIPKRAFIKSSVLSQRKPQFVDFTSPASLSILTKRGYLLEKDLFIEEMIQEADLSEKKVDKEGSFPTTCWISP